MVKFMENVYVCPTPSSSWHQASLPALSDFTSNSALSNKKKLLAAWKQQFIHWFCYSFGQFLLIPFESGS